MGKEVLEAKKKLAREKHNEVNESFSSLYSQLAFKSYEFRTLLDKIKEKIDAIKLQGVEREEEKEEMKEIDLEKQAPIPEQTLAESRIVEVPLEKEKTVNKTKLALVIIFSPLLIAFGAIFMVWCIVCLLFLPFAYLWISVIDTNFGLKEKTKKLLYLTSPLWMPLLTASLAASWIPGMFIGITVAGRINSRSERNREERLSPDEEKEIDKVSFICFVFGLWILIAGLIALPFYLLGLLVIFIVSLLLKKNFEDEINKKKFVPICIFSPVLLPLLILFLVLCLVFGPFYYLGTQLKKYLMN